MNEIDGIDLTEEIVIMLPKALYFPAFGSSIGIFCRKRAKKLRVRFAVSKKKSTFELDFSVINDTKIE